MFESFHNYKLYSILIMEHNERLRRKERYRDYRTGRVLKSPSRTGLVVNLKKRLGKQKTTV